MENKERKKRFNQEVSDLKCNEQLKNIYNRGDDVIYWGKKCRVLGDGMIDGTYQIRWNTTNIIYDNIKTVDLKKYIF